MPPLALPLKGLNITLTAQPLTPEAFAPFGTVVQNPRPDVHPSRFADLGPPPLPLDAVSANQGSAIKYQHVTRMVNNYQHAPSGKPGVAVMNMFVCAARKLRERRFFAVHILERHPYTTQTFSPLSISGSPAASAAAETSRYLVIVAPDSASRPLAALESSAVGPPDLSRIKAFVATTGQAVTYGAGTWHAPMVALGPEGSALDFVVTQFANGVGNDDCQEVTFGEEGDGAVCVEVPAVSSMMRTSKL